jgi:hypothetical protein
MRIRGWSVVLGLLVALVVLVLSAITAVGWQVVLGPKARPATARKFDVTEAHLARGKYLTDIAPCFH